MVAGTMDGPSGLMLLGAGLAGGIVTAVAGGASLITFPGAAGGGVTAGLLLVTPERAFTAVVPLLIGLATILFAGAGRLRRWTLSRAAGRNGTRVSSAGLRLLLFAPVAVYGGYFGAGMSVMLLAILSVSDTDDFRATNVIKNLLSGLTSLGGAVVGGFLGGRLARVLPPNLIRGAVITVGAILSVTYAWRYWLR